MNLVIPISIGKEPVPPLNDKSNAPEVNGYPVPNTIPPPNKFPSTSGAAVNPQLSTIDPVKEENVRLGSITNSAVSSKPFGNSNETILF